MENLNSKFVRNSSTNNPIDRNFIVEGSQHETSLRIPVDSIKKDSYFFSEWCVSEEKAVAN